MSAESINKGKPPASPPSVSFCNAYTITITVLTIALAAIAVISCLSANKCLHHSIFGGEGGAKLVFTAAVLLTILGVALLSCQCSKSAQVKKDPTPQGAPKDKLEAKDEKKGDEKKGDEKKGAEKDPLLNVQ